MGKGNKWIIYRSNINEVYEKEFDISINFGNVG